MVFGSKKKEVERGGAGAVVAAARRAIGHEHKEKTAAEKAKEELGEFCCPALTLKQRFTGTLVSLGLAGLWFVLCIGSLSTGNISMFGIYYTFGNLAAVARCGASQSVSFLS